MSATAYYQRVSIPLIGFAHQNHDASQPDYLPFESGVYSDNAGSDADEVSLSFPLGTFTQAVIEKLITEGGEVIVIAESGPAAIVWSYSGQVVDAAINLTSIEIVVGSRLKPISSGVQVPGVVPFRVLTTANAGKLPTSGR